MSLLPLRYWSHVLGRWEGQRARLAYDPGTKSPGDALIRLGERQLMAAYDITLVPPLEKPDVIFWGGGGNMGNLYPGAAAARFHLSTKAKHLQVPFVILPSTWNAPEFSPCDVAFARERGSTEFSPQAFLAPDMALAYTPGFDISVPQFEVGNFFRRDNAHDKESAHPRRANLSVGDPQDGVSNPSEYIRKAAQYEKIHTDRLHFAIAGLLCERDVTLYANNYHKNESMWATGWLMTLGCKFVKD